MDQKVFTIQLYMKNNTVIQIYSNEYFNYDRIGAYRFCVIPYLEIGKRYFVDDIMLARYYLEHVESIYYDKDYTIYKLQNYEKNIVYKPIN